MLKNIQKIFHTKKFHNLIELNLIFLGGGEGDFSQWKKKNWPTKKMKRNLKSKWNEWIIPTQLRGEGGRNGPGPRGPSPGHRPLEAGLKRPRPWTRPLPAAGDGPRPRGPAVTGRRRWALGGAEGEGGGGGGAAAVKAAAVAVAT